MLGKHGIWLPSVKKQRRCKASRASLRSHYDTFRDKSTTVPVPFHSVGGFWKTQAARCLQRATERPRTPTQRTSHPTFPKDQPRSLSKGCRGAAIPTVLVPALGSTGGDKLKTAFRPISAQFKYMLHLRFAFQAHGHHGHQKLDAYLHLSRTRSAEPCSGAGAPAFTQLQSPAGALVWRMLVLEQLHSVYFYSSPGPHPRYLVQGRRSWLGVGCCAPHRPHRPAPLPGEWGQGPASTQGKGFKEIHHLHANTLLPRGVPCSASASASSNAGFSFTAFPLLLLEQERLLKGVAAIFSQWLSTPGLLC